MFAGARRLALKVPSRRGLMRLTVTVDEHETRASVAEDPSAFEELWWGKRLGGVRVNLRAADPQWVFELLEESWRRKAPKRVAMAFDTNQGR